jgi:monovalent cation/hydrogen antiporter
VRVHLATGLVLLTVVVVLVAGLARRFGLPAPLILVAVGVLGGYLPAVPEVRLEPDLVLVGLLPPLLYAAAIRTSLVDLRADRSAIGLLSVGATLFTTVVVGLVAWRVVPGPFPLAAALALGAVVAPPDAVAATAIARRVGMPRRLVSILEGESLINDATALVALSTAVAAIEVSINVWRVGWDFLLAAGGGVVAGLVVALVFARIRHVVHDPVTDTALSLVAPFVAYILAEEVHASGVLAVVVTGIALGHKSHLLQSGAARLAEASNWRTIQFLLENAVFLLIGLQMPFVVEQARREVSDSDLFVVCLAVLLAVLISRPVWVFATYGIRRLIGDRMADSGWSPRASVLIGWAGMRGVVTLAAAFSLPPSTPHRGVLLLAAMVVVVGTLAMQGLTLPALARRLGLPAPDPAEDALAQAALLSEVAGAGRRRLASERVDSDPSEVVAALERQSTRRVDRAWERLGRPNHEYEPPTAVYLRLRLAMLEAERASIIEARDAGRYDDEVLRAVTVTLDVEESLLDRQELSVERTSTRLVPPVRTQGCEHLAQAPTVVRPGTPEGCRDCLAEGATWVHLRLCLECGQVGCCDSSPGRHAAKHFEAAGHPVMRSFEPHEHWRWCFVDRALG